MTPLDDMTASQAAEELRQRARYSLESAAGIKEMEYLASLLEQGAQAKEKLGAVEHEICEATVYLRRKVGLVPEQDSPMKVAEDTVKLIAHLDKRISELERRERMDSAKFAELSTTAIRLQRERDSSKALLEQGARDTERLDFLLEKQQPVLGWDRDLIDERLDAARGESKP